MFGPRLIWRISRGRRKTDRPSLLNAFMQTCLLLTVYASTAVLRCFLERLSFAHSAKCFDLGPCEGFFRIAMKMVRPFSEIASCSCIWSFVRCNVCAHTLCRVTVETLLGSMPRGVFESARVRQIPCSLHDRKVIEKCTEFHLVWHCVWEAFVGMPPSRETRVSFTSSLCSQHLLFACSAKCFDRGRCEGVFGVSLKKVHPSSWNSFNEQSEKLY